MNAFVPLKTLPLPILTTSKTCGEGREGGSMWGPPVPWQEWEGLQRKYNVAFFKMEKAMFEREVLATELDNHASTIAKLQFALPKHLGPYT